MSPAAGSYDVVVIGAGPAGYVAAIRCAQLGLKVACVDDFIGASGKPALGGTCLNVGCIPSKALLDSTHLYATLTEHGAEHGIRADGMSFDVSAMQKRKDRLVLTLTKGIEGLFKKNGVERIHGRARLAMSAKSGNRVAVASTKGAAGDEQNLDCRHVIIGSGSVPAALSSAPFDGQRIVDSTGALSFSEVPARLGIVGAGVIGLELGSVWRRLGAEVIVIEALEQFLPAVDAELAREAQKLFRQQGLDIRLGCRLKSAAVNGQAVTVQYEDAKGLQNLEVDRLIVAVGRKPRTADLGVEAVGLKLDARGFIAVDEYCRTNLPGVYAIGDVAPGPMLAHKGSEEGVAVAEHIVGKPGLIDHHLIPWVIYTAPEIAWVGKTEEALKAEGIVYRSGTFPFAASGRAKALGETAGRVKVLADAKTDRVLGAHILGPQASELISEAVTVIAFEGCAEDIARTVHAHPTLAEAMHEAALGVDGRMLNL